MSIGVYLDGSDLKYYFFENGDIAPKISTSLVELKQELPSGLENSCFLQQIRLKN